MLRVFNAELDQFGFSEQQAPKTSSLHSACQQHRFDFDLHPSAPHVSTVHHVVSNLEEDSEGGAALPCIKIRARKPSSLSKWLPRSQLSRLIPHSNLPRTRSFHSAEIMIRHHASLPSIRTPRRAKTTDLTINTSSLDCVGLCRYLAASTLALCCELYP